MKYNSYVEQFEMLAKIHSSVRNISPRGGSTIIEVDFIAYLYSFV